MSAVPLPALVLAGTWDLPSSVALIFSAKAGPAKATVAPSASVTSMVLVFDMVVSLLASIDGAGHSNTRIRDLFPEADRTPLNFRAVYGWKSGHASR